MKKEYQAPAVEVLECIMAEMIAVSGVGSENGIGYGGVDEGGVIEAESRPFFDNFPFDE
jgi:hypothetical protein